MTTNPSSEKTRLLAGRRVLVVVRNNAIDCAVLDLRALLRAVESSCANSQALRAEER